MTDVKIPFGRATSGRMVSVEQVERGLACDCVCPTCRAPLIAAKGEVYRHHFRHLAEDVHCAFAWETSLHQFAKQIICDRLQLRLPDAMGTMIRARLETLYGWIVPDVLARYDSGEALAIEIWVAHQVGQDKVRQYNKQKIAAVEIDLRQYRFADKSETEWEKIVLFEAERSWLSPPSHIRKRRQEARQLRLKQQREKAEQEQRQLLEWQRQQALERERLRILEADRAAKIEVERQIALIKEIAWREDQQRQARDREAERLKLAQAQEKEWEFRRVVQRRLKADMACPDLQALVVTHGTYDRIPPEAWDDFNRRMTAWTLRVVTGEFHQPPYPMLRAMR